jgi:hypothetical protein
MNKAASILIANMQHCNSSPHPSSTPLTTAPLQEIIEFLHPCDEPWRDFSELTWSRKQKATILHCKQQNSRMEEEVQALVIDNGSGMCKAGKRNNKRRISIESRASFLKKKSKKKKSFFFLFSFSSHQRLRRR